MFRTEVYYSGDKFGGNVNKCELTNLTLNCDESGYYLSARFEVEDKHSLREAVIPKIRLTIQPDKVILAHTDSDREDRRTHIDLGFGYMPLEYGEVEGQRRLYSEKVLKENVTEMTLDEIEKKLGHKIKIVNKKG